MERQNMTHAQTMPGAAYVVNDNRISVGRYVLGLLVAMIVGMFAYLVVPEQIALAFKILTWATVGFYLVRLVMALRNHMAMSRIKLQIGQEQLIQQRLMTEQQRFDNRKVVAEVKKMERDATVLVVTAKHDEQIFIRDMEHAKWIKAHLDPRVYANGQASPPSPLELAVWGQFHRPAPAALQSPTSGLALPPGYELPSLVRWHDLVPGQRGDLNNLVLGLRLNEQGQLAPLTVSLYDLFHTIAAASSGYGKSAFVNAILAQLATCPAPVEFVLIDQQDQGLAAFRQCDRLRYPILRQPSEILSALREVYHEAVTQRSELLRRYDADDLEEYNQRADEFLPPIIVAVDEASALLTADKEISAELKKHAWELRKFGVYQFLMLTSAKGTTIDTDHRQQFSSKIQLHANEKAQARLLVDAPEATSFPPGRAVIELPGLPPTVVQTPFIDKRQVRALLRPANTPPTPPPELEPEQDTPTENQRRTLELWDSGERNIGFIARSSYDGTGGRQEELVRKTLEKFGRI
jgi:hypothetical protein